MVASERERKSSGISLQDQITQIPITRYRAVIEDERVLNAALQDGTMSVRVASPYPG